MRYFLNKQNYCNFDLYEEHKLPGRSYFIPYPNRNLADSVSPLQKRYASSKVQCLNGIWDFKFYPIPGEMPDILDTDRVEFDKLEVPSCW